jgi:RING finger protein 113A
MEEKKCTQFISDKHNLEKCRLKKLRESRLIFTTNKKQSIDLQTLTSNQNSNYKLIHSKKVNIKEKIYHDLYDNDKIMIKLMNKPEDILKKENGLYRGIAKYRDYRSGLRRDHSTNLENVIGAHGPQKASLHIRNSVSFDYQPGICKDYKETGYCGYGDACKFMHDRSDYKFGWQIEKEYQESIKKKIKENSNNSFFPQPVESKTDHFLKDGSLPLVCLICRRPWDENSNPVKTNCKHYFHETCALKNSKLNGRCFFCGEPTKGIYNSAVEIIRNARKYHEQNLILKIF